ncbi:carboxymuconolactone decarboxylase family protein [Breoghania sp.]|uniref:carboxymuconolactone decarboxylase family protein n=1 Tax=Breoghania sp. TaxID=2065378 RepID=UPI00262DBC0B|nr:carboxymuconolactone decarboxylase family protein [Breoghania sp.]MDJ0932797.1 carboxymuconolactone decarboxylase family protein [Breoghania sp.]
MKKLAASVVMAATATMAQAEGRPEGGVAPDAVYQVAPQLGCYTDEVLFGTVWPAEDVLSRRDRSLITISALIAGGRIPQLGAHLRTDLENGLTPRELSELVTHLAFYSGWPVAIFSVDEIKAVFENAGVSVDIDPRATPLTADPQAEAARAEMVDRFARPVLPGLADDTDEVLFADLWLRDGLAPRDRSLMTVAALVGMGQAEQLSFHLNRAMDAGLTREEAAEAIRHLAYYTGWPRAFSALPVVTKVFEDQQASTEAEPATLEVVRGAEAKNLCRVDRDLHRQRHRRAALLRTGRCAPWRWTGSLRSWCAYRVAHSPARADALCHRGLRAGAD